MNEASCFAILLAKCYLLAMLQADDEDEMMEQQMKSPFGSSFRTFDATDYKPIGTTFIPLLDKRLALSFPFSLLLLLVLNVLGTRTRLHMSF